MFGLKTHRGPLQTHSALDIAEKPINNKNICIYFDHSPMTKADWDETNIGLPFFK